MYMTLPHLLLASTSPRRRELIAITGWPYRLTSADVDESPLPAEPPADYVQRLARSKALAAAPHARPDEIVLAADTTVADGLQILGKPRDASEAESMLRQLCGRTHQVLTAIAVHDPHNEAMEIDLCVASVPMRNYTDAEIYAYIASGDPLDKAGAYAIQNGAFRPVAAFSGCYACVVGLPLCHLQCTLSRLGFPPPEDVPTACQNHLSYNCPIYLRVLQGERIG
jgi:septum formation protein